MAAIHTISKPVINSNLDMFSVLPTHTQILKADYQPYGPQIPLDDATGGENGVIDFLIADSPESYINLYDTFLRIKVAIKNADTKAYMTEKDLVGPINNLFHSLFSQVDVTINDQVVTSSTHTYAFKAYMEILFNYSKESVESLLSCLLFVPDTPGFMDSLLVESGTDDDKRVVCDNKGLLERWQYFVDGKGSVELIGKPLFSLSCQPKLLLNNTKLKYSFMRNKDSFCLMYKSGGANYKIIIEEASLFVRKTYVDSKTLLAHQQVLSTGENAKYASRSGIVRKLAIASGLSSHQANNLGISRIPTRMFAAMTRTSALTGHCEKNPLNFIHANTNFIASLLEGAQYPLRGFRPDFEKESYLRSFFSLLAACRCDFNSDGGHLITRRAYPRGYTIFAIEFSPNSNLEEAFDLIKKGSLQLDVNFKTPLVEPTSLLVYCEYETLLEISLDRTVKFDPLV